ncbi:uroporphyrinogen-III C-methyltransferase [Natronospora cellulosivora (SeqCode)]
MTDKLKVVKETEIIQDSETVIKDNGTVYLIGAGPGDYRLMTCWGREVLEEADIVFYDRLANPSLLTFTREDARLVYVGKEPDNHFFNQEEINQMIVKAAKDGKMVVRLKGGDPYVYGRGGEEALELIKAGIDFKVIPGISSVLAAASYAGIPITHRGLSSSFHVFTGHKLESMDFEHLARIDGTMVIVMGLRNLEGIAKNLIQEGVSKEKAVAIIHYGTTASQKIISGNLSNIAEKARVEEVQSPVLIVIGDVVKLYDELNWYEKGVLSGKRILLTRSREENSKMASKIEASGGEAFFLPAIKIEGPIIDDRIKEYFYKIKEYDWLLFTSTNTVNNFFAIMKELNLDIRCLTEKKIATIGPATEQSLNKVGIYSDIQTEESTAKGLAETLIKEMEKEQKILLPGSNLARKELSNTLSKAGHQVDRITIYRTTLPDHQGKRYDLFFTERKVDLICFTSPSTVENLCNITEKYLDIIQEIPVVCIGPVTANAAKEHGFDVQDVASEHNIDGLLKSVIKVFGH